MFTSRSWLLFLSNISFYESIITFLSIHLFIDGLPKWLSGKEISCHAGNWGWIPGSERSSGEVFLLVSLQYSFLGNPTDRGAWQATVHGVTKSWTWLSDFTLLSFTFSVIEPKININRSLAGYSPRGRKKLDMTEWLTWCPDIWSNITLDEINILIGDFE